MNSFWITDAVLLTMDPKRSTFLGSVRVEDGKISKIVRSGPKVPKSIPKGEKQVSSKGKLVMPGFIQAHTHLCQTLARNRADDLELMDWLQKKIWVMESRHTYETLKVSAELGIHELLSGGTTTILDMGTVRHTEAIFEAVKQTGIRASVGKCLMDHPITTPTSLRERTRDALNEAVSLFRKWNGRENDRIRVSYAPRFVVSCTEELLLGVSKAALEQDATIHTHASENLKEIQIVKGLVGCENIEYLEQLGFLSPNLVLAHCIWLKPNEMKFLKNSGTHVVHCPSSNLKLASGIAHIPEMLKKGINVALGADGAPCNNNLNMFQEMRLAALIHKPQGGPRTMRAPEILEMATLRGARALNWEDTIGSIEVGKQADLICLDFNKSSCAPIHIEDLGYEDLASAIVYSGAPSLVEWSMVQGKIVYKNGRVKGLSLQKILQESYRAQRELSI